MSTDTNWERQRLTGYIAKLNDQITLFNAQKSDIESRISAIQAKITEANAQLAALGS